MKKNSAYKRYQEKKRQVSGKRIVGIDPAKEKHYVTVLDAEGIQMGKSFSILVSFGGGDGVRLADVHLG